MPPLTKLLVQGALLPPPRHDSGWAGGLPPSSSRGLSSPHTTAPQHELPSAELHQL